MKTGEVTRWLKVGSKNIQWLVPGTLQDIEGEDMKRKQQRLWEGMVNEIEDFTLKPERGFQGGWKIKDANRSSKMRTENGSVLLCI